MSLIIQPTSWGAARAQASSSCPHRPCSSAHQPYRLLSSRSSRLQTTAAGRTKPAGRRRQHPARSVAVPEDWGDFDALTQQLEELAAEVGELLQGASLYLVGMMGSGKSKTGRVLSSFLQYPFLDTDEMIEEVAGQKIADIFKQSGEEAFREMETQILQEVMPIKSCIVSTGGGIVERNDNWAMMSHAVIIWLHGETPLLARRVVADGRASRPMLKDGEQGGSDEHQEHQRTVARLEQILERRKDRYALADLRVPIDGVQPSEQEEGAPVMGVVLRILQALEKRLKDDVAQRQLAQQFEVHAVTDLPNCNIVEARTNGKST